jgi:hypothetical protein
METKGKSKFERGSKKYKEAVSGNIDRKIANAPKDIPGWGIDADIENDPTYPMKHTNGADYERSHYKKPTQQHSNVKVFRSIERPELSSVFGTSTPPSGISGAIRGWAYKFSEADIRHWLTLIFADRINVIEGIIDDLRHGIVPDIIAERGWTAEWKYNRQGVIKKAVVGLALTSVVVALLVYRNRSKKVSLQAY